MLQTLRDLAIVIVAIETIIVGIGALILIWQVWRLIGFARRHAEELSGRAGNILDIIKETAQSTAQAARHAEGTAEFVSDRTAKPVIEMYSAVAGASRFAQAILRHQGSNTEPTHE
ncbi:MAG TPA: hypothetical protein VFC51_12940 [Chloroflexota bacterium]|nr:hypothetical protein [Chloroflexota bacterium]